MKIFPFEWYMTRLVWRFNKKVIIKVRISTLSLPSITFQSTYNFEILACRLAMCYMQGHGKKARGHHCWRIGRADFRRHFQRRCAAWRGSAGRAFFRVAPFASFPLFTTRGRSAAGVKESPPKPLPHFPFLLPVKRDCWLLENSANMKSWSPGEPPLWEFSKGSPFSHGFPFKAVFNATVSMHSKKEFLLISYNSLG